MTEVAPGCPGTALAPPHTAPTASRNASPCRSASDHGSPSGTRRQLAKDKREEDEKAQELLEALRDKERRAQQQLDRCAEERGRKMEEQRRKEQKRRAAAEEKRRQQQEAEKVRGRPYANAALTALAGASSWLPSFSFLYLN